MSMNMDAAIRIKANIQGANAIQAFSRDLKSLDGAAKLSGAELGRMNIAINRMAREAGNTTAGLRQHIAALSNLRDRVEIGGKAYNRLGGEIDALRGKLRALDKDAGKTGDTLKEQLIGGLATAGVGGLAAGIIQNASGLDAEVRKAAAIEGTSSYDTLRKSIEEVAKVAAGTPTDVAKLATALSRSGFTAKETAQSLEGIVMAAEATDVAFEEMGSIGADAMRAFGIDTSKTSQVMDILVKTANSSNQTVLDLGESLKYAAPIARSLGVNINDLSATMGILANNGIRGSEAGTALRTGLGRLQLAASGSQDQLLELTRGSGLLADAMKTLGANVLDAQGNLKPMDQVLIGLKQNLEKMPKGVQVEVMKALFGDEAGGKLRAALNSSEADIRKMFDAIRNSGGAVESTHEQMRGFDYTMKVLTGNIETVTNAIGDKFIAVLDPLAKIGISVLDVLLKMPQPLQDLAAWLAAAGIAAGGLGLAIKTLGFVGSLTGITAGLTTAIQGFATSTGLATIATGGLSGAMTVLRGAIMAIPGWGWAIAGVTAIATLGKALYDNNEGFRNWVNNVGRVIASDFNNAMNTMKSLAAGAIKGVSGAWQWLVGATRNAATAIGNAFSGPFGFISNAASKVFGSVQKAIAGLWNALPEPIRKALGQAGKMAINVVTATPIGYLASVGVRASQMGPQQTVNRSGKGNLPNVLPAAPTGGGDGTLPPGTADAGGDAAKKAAAEAKRALDQYNTAVKTGTDLTRGLAAQTQDVELNMKAIGANAAQAIGVQRLKDETAAFRDYGEAQRKIAELEEQRRTAAAKGISTKDLDVRIEAAKDLAANLHRVKMAEIDSRSQQALIDLLPKEAEYNQKLKEAAILAENKKKGIEGLTEVQKLNLQIEMLGLEVLSLTNPALAEQIRLLRERAQALDNANKTDDKSFGESFKDKIKGYTDSVKDLGGALGGIAVNALTNLEDRLLEFVTTGKMKFKEFVASVLSDLAKLAIRLAIVNTIKAVFPNAGFANGGIMTANGPVPLKKYARGGIASSPQLALFGEGSKPEAYVPLPDGRRIPVAMEGGGGTSVVVNVDAKGSSVQGNSGQGEQLGRAVAQAVQAELIKQKRPGGLLAA